ncbi:cytochrome P450 6j1-like [Ctenocephalides felis]|uniref:cytochrome P450 6j1-like n=1 Tax=Ctenocephalides felis TaxID=7515 RepID=UPI000E6E51CC|nr:cytochrome P450 6j1-like [Ctenocephalides felis]
MVFLLLIATALTLFLGYVWHVGSYWSKKKVPAPCPGESYARLWTNFTLSEHFGLLLDKTYNFRRFQGKPYFGAFSFFKPLFVIRDLDLVKTVLQTNFNSFQKNDFDIDEELEPIFATNPFSQSGQKWKRSRTQITPAFTSGRMKAMYPLMIEVGDRMKKYLEKNEGIPEGIDTKSLSEKFAMDNVASCAFGIDVESFTDKDSDFIRVAKKIFEPSFTNMIKFLIAFMVPFLSKILKIRLMPKETADFMTQIVTQNVKYREDHKIVRDDFLQGMINSKGKGQGEFPPLTNLEMTGHAVSFLTDGYETSSAVMAFVFYAVAKHKHVQDKLRQEILDVLKKHDGQVTYEAIMEMQYLEQVLYETMRLYPPGMILQKRCTQDCTIPGKSLGAEDITLREGDAVVIPLYSIQRDPEYYPDPEKFDPERFSDEEKASRHSYAFLTFGAGPRMCLGMRFALLQMKVALMSAVKSFELSVNPKTKEPLELDNKSFIIRVKDGMWVDFKKL